MRELSFKNLFLNVSFWYQYCTIIFQVKSKILTSFESLVRKSARKWRLGASVDVHKNNVFQLSRGIRKFYRSSLKKLEHTLEKNFFAAATFEGFQVVPFQTVKNLVVYMVCMALLRISGEDKTKRILFIRSKRLFYM